MLLLPDEDELEVEKEDGEDSLSWTERVDELTAVGLHLFGLAVEADSNLFFRCSMDELFEVAFDRWLTTLTEDVWLLDDALEC